MAARFRKVDPRFWHDEKVQTLPIEGKLLALYLLTGPEANRIGLYRFSPAKASDELKIKRLDTLCHTVSDTLSWGYSEAQKLIYFPTWWKYNSPENEKAFKGYLKDLHDIPRDPLISLFLDNIKHLPKKLIPILERYRLDTVCHTLCHTVSPLETETETEKDSSAPNDEAPPPVRQNEKGRTVKTQINPDLEKMEWEGINPLDYGRWSVAYPAVEVPAELARMLEWLRANPKNRKSNYARFISNWFMRAQDKAARVASFSGATPTREQDDGQAAAAELLARVTSGKS